jgi:serine-type D-Ala-D-Ala carboxypeptidase/endopeptidase
MNGCTPAQSSRGNQTNWCGRFTPLEPVRQSITLPASSLEEYVGTYKLEDKFLLKILRIHNQLYGGGTGQSAFRLFPWAPDECFPQIPGISISFTRDTKQAVTGLVLHQNGNHVAPKMRDAELLAEPDYQRGG